MHSARSYGFNEIDRRDGRSALLNAATHYLEKLRVLHYFYLVAGLVAYKKIAMGS